MKGVTAVAAAALLLSGLATPAEAGRRHRHHHDDVDAGDVVAGAVLVGGIAALASGIKRARRARQDAAVEACAGEAEYRSGGRLSEILTVDKRKGYYRVEGALDSDRDGDGFQQTFTCTVRNGRIYAMRLSGMDDLAHR